MSYSYANNHPHARARFTPGKNKPRPVASFAPAPTQPGSPAPQHPQPAGPGGPPGGSLAGDPNLIATQDSGNRDRWLADATAQWQRGDLAADYGFDATGGIDPNNPYSRAALLQENYRRSLRGTTNNYASAGQMYSGARHRALDEGTRQYSIGFDQLQRGYQRGQTQIGLDWVNAYNQSYGDETGALLQALLSAIGGKK